MPLNDGKIPLKVLFFIGAGIVLLFSGISIFGVPKYEVLFDRRPPIGTCVAEQKMCTYIYILDVGNTGSEDQDDVIVDFTPRAIADTILPLSVSNFGKVARRGVAVSGGRYALGRLESGKRVEFRLVLQRSADREAPKWEEILLSVKAAQGDARPGPPDLTRWGRMMYTIFGL